MKDTGREHPSQWHESSWQAQHEDDRSLGQLFSDATRESADLVRKEIELARIEVADNVASLKASATTLALGVPLVFAGFVFLLLAAVLALDRAVHEPWLSAALVGGTVVLFGVLALLLGRRGIKRSDVRPRRSADSLRSDKQMLQRHVGASS